ncbi:MAG: cobalt transporter CbiM [Bacillota bacterium]|nr:cobalt transporter CbiM [Bacillota bacterium]
MHIPDGYMSPSTYAVMGAAAAPFVAHAVSRVRRESGDRHVPAIALGSAFAFALMMLNVPVPDGTTAHAVGGALLAVVLGPWAAVLAVTVVLIVQAVFFGDGGLLALGANVFNMAVLEPLAGYAVYRLLSARRPGRRPWAAALGAFVGINLAALATGVELGVQPLLFRSASGTPLYAPYPLQVAVPAMLLAHLLVAGPVEAVVTGLVVGFLVRSGAGLYEPHAATGARLPRWAWAGLGLLVLSTPLGLLAHGTAWGEWGAEELKAQLGYVPEGIRQAASAWHGLLPDYALPGFGHGWGEVAGTWLVVLLGIVLVALAVRLLLAGRRRRVAHPGSGTAR